MNPTIIAALIGFFSAAATSAVAAWISYRKLKSDLISRYQRTIAERQIEAYEAFWSILEQMSFDGREGRVIQGHSGSYLFSRQAALELVENLTTTFHMRHGLYLSRSTRSCVFSLRAALKEKSRSSELSEIQISNREAKRIRGKATALRICLRREMGLEDLKALEQLARLDF